jgi:hypothetical protein
MVQSVRAGILAVVLFVAAPVHADVLRLRFRGVQSTGPAPLRLDRAVESHLAVALKQRGTELVRTDPVDAEASARCSFSGAPHTATCLVEVVRPGNNMRAERRADIPFRDSEDLAESLALLVSDVVATDLDSLSPQPEPEPEPVQSPKPPPPAIEVHPPKPKPTSPPPPTAIHLGAGPVVVVGFTGEPVLGGLWSRGPFRLGGTLSLTGGASDPQPWHLTFFRLLTAVRVGAGFERGRFGFDATLGPGLLVLSTDAHQPAGPEAQHTLATFAGVGGVRLAVRLHRAVALALDVDAAVAGGVPIQEFSLGSLELALTLAYRL